MDQELIREGARDPDTYLHYREPTAAREFFQGILDIVLVGQESAEIRYRIPENNMGAPAGSYTHEVDLGKLHR